MFAGSIPQMGVVGRDGQTEARSQELSLGLLCDSQVTRYLKHCLLLPEYASTGSWSVLDTNQEFWCGTEAS